MLCRRVRHRRRQRGIRPHRRVARGTAFRQTARPRRQPAGPWYRDRGPHRKHQDRDKRAGASVGQSASHRRGSRDTLDHVSKGRLIFGVGRSGVVKTYEALNIAYSESKDREIECLEIIQRAWQEDNFSYKGKFYDIQDVTVVPQPVQQPTPEIRIAAVSVETFPAAGKAG